MNPRAPVSARRPVLEPSKRTAPGSPEAAVSSSYGAPGVGLEPTTFRLTAGRICQIELPRNELPVKTNRQRFPGV
jgi:hypothetical protein